jgi:DNA repair exonuclease SbcCD nuclease subunit
MIEKIVHFSDLHIRLFKDHDQYREIVTEMLQQFAQVKPDRIVFTGDLVHSKNQMTPELIQMVSWVLSECSKIAKTILIIGNHDFLESNLSRVDALSPIIDSLKNDNIFYYKEKGVYSDENIDWVVYSLIEHNIQPEIEKSDRVKIGLFHGPIVGLTTDIGFTFEDGYDTSRFAGCDLVLCGDIHKRQIFDIPGGKKAYMVGSTIQQNFGESITKHGYGTYLVSKDEYTFTDLHNSRPFLSFKISDILDLQNGTEKLVNY